jgi:hypothetical protein
LSGYVRLYRSLIDEHPAFRNDAEAMAFAWLVAKAAWQPTKVRYKERIIFLDRGQAAISVRDFARAMDRDKAWIERLLKRLKAETMVTTRCETGVNIVTICNYEIYQRNGLGRETLGETPHETGARQGQDTEQVIEESKEDNNSASQSVARQPVQEAVSFWNDNAGSAGWKRISALNDARRAHVRNRLREHGLKGWKAAIARARASPYLAGSDPPSWFTFDWLCKPTNFLKVIEGNYDRRNSDSADPTLVALSSFRNTGPGG